MKQENQVPHSTTNTAALLPCPFCGKAAMDQWPNETLDASGDNCVRCAWCHGAAPMNTWNRRALTQQQGGEQEAGDGDRQARELWARELRAKGMVCEAVGVTYGPWDQKEDAAIRAISAALRSKQPAASEGDGIRVERAEYFSPTEGGHFLRVVYRWPHNGKLLRHTQFVELHSKDQVEHLIVLLNTSKQAAGEAVPIGWFTDDHLTDRSATTYDKTVADRWVAKGWPITPIYTTPPRHPADEDAEQLSKSDKDYILRTQNLLLGFMLDCNAIGAKEAGVNLARSMKEKAALQAGTP